MKKLLFGMLALGIAALPAIAQSAGAGGGQGSGQGAASGQSAGGDKRRAVNKCRRPPIRWRPM